MTGVVSNALLVKYHELSLLTLLLVWLRERMYALDSRAYELDDVLFFWPLDKPLQKIDERVLCHESTNCNA